MMTHGCDFDSADFQRVDRWVTRLRRKLKDDKLCPGCIARVLLLHGAHQLSGLVGIENAVVSMVNLAADIHDALVPPPDCPRH